MNWTRLREFNQRSLLAAWIVLGLLVIFGTQVCSSIWALGNPAPHHWDNALYLNHACNDLWAYSNGGPTWHRKGISGVWDSLINSDPYVPPAYRIVTAPFIFWGVKMLPLLRAISLLVFWLTLYVIYKTAAVAIDGPAGKAAGIIAAMLVALYLAVGWSIRVYGTEFTLYFAEALMLYCLARSTKPIGRSHGTWIGLGFALGLGILSKISFVMLAGPPVLVALVLVILRRLPGLSIWKLLASALIALLMAWPFYSRHFVSAKDYGQDMLKFERHSLHRNGLELIKAWAQLHLTEGVGIGAAAVAGELLGVALLLWSFDWMWNWRKDQTPGLRYAQEPDSAADDPGLGLTSDPASGARWIILMSLASGLVLPLFQLFFSTNDNVRHVSPAYIPLTLAIALAVALAGGLLAGWSWLLLIAAAVPALKQVQRMDVPLTTTVDDVWNWQPLFNIVEAHGVRFPMIGHIGNSAQFCDPFLTEPWESRGRFANSRWLWRSEEGPFNLDKVRAELNEKGDARNVVVTVPNLLMPKDNSMLADPLELDNSCNTAFANAMLRDSEWELAGRFPIGSVNRGEVWVFVRK